MILRKVVLPEPEGPRMEANSHSRKETLTPSRALVTELPVLKTLLISRISNTNTIITWILGFGEGLFGF